MSEYAIQIGGSSMKNLLSMEHLSNEEIMTILDRAQAF